MKFQLAGHGWPIGAYLIPTGTIIDTNDPDDPWRWLWQGQLPHRPPPPNALPFDQETYDVLALTYGAYRIPGPLSEEIVRA
jgi:hypothetical protein